MKYDKAYSELLEECLTIYEVRELNFDQENDYDSDNDFFFCPDESCRLEQKQKISINDRQCKESCLYKDATF